MNNATTERLDPLGGKLLLPAFLAALVLCAVVMLFAGGEARAQEERSALDQYSSVTADTSWVSELQKIDEASPVEVPPIEGDPVEIEVPPIEGDLIEVPPIELAPIEGDPIEVADPDPAPSPGEEPPAEEPPAGQYQYGPGPDTEPEPGPVPEPTPEPVPEPEPEPAPDPAPELPPEPSPEPAPEPSRLR